MYFSRAYDYDKRLWFWLIITLPLKCLKLQGKLEKKNPKLQEVFYNTSSKLFLLKLTAFFN